MKHLSCWILLTLTALALSRSAFGAELLPTPIAVGPTQLPGVATDITRDGFSLVTLGNWRTPVRLNLGFAPRPADNQISKVHLSSRLGSNFRRALYLPHVQAAERRYALPRGLLDALIWTESRYNPLALSKAGAVGLGQLMPRTATELGVSNPYDARANLIGAAQYLRQMIDQFGAIHLAIAAYNAGPSAVRVSKGIPRNMETPDYVQRVIVAWRNIQQP
ncbi:lytic transglycosylase domain-containing protein [Novosphingobium sp. PASSN1]|uniref:lytic transglycosylase domain-containing protein n=1 Tax=Novosphingobium sp. PASSN1 TaxID=2015561 RepID=UPI000BCA3784|nr:lytic transglycosylase domain-containing protein [Novosphingobium sp. PASSN1]OYU33104.1 MAG: lytic transglycosylase [Novosphingobium sp. PASSN1]